MQLLFMLADSSRGLAPETAVLAFWPDADDTRARGSLHSTIYRVRAALGERAAVELDNGRYFLRWPGEIRYDVAQMTALLDKAARSNDDEARARLLAEALDLARGDYLEGVTAAWCLERRMALDEIVTRAQLDLAETRLRLGQTRLAVASFEVALARDPLREEGHRGLMRAHLAMGNRALALRQFDLCRAVLAEELGAEPDPATTELQRRLASPRREA